MKRRIGLLIVLMVNFWAILAPVAEAAPFARPDHVGYFYGIYDGLGDDVATGIFPTSNPLSPTGKPCVESFISIIDNWLNGGSSNRNQTAAEFIILTMVGRGAGTPKSQAHGADRTTWENRVRYYSDQGWINWGPGSSCNGVTVAHDTNTFWQGNYGAGPDPDDDAWYDTPGRVSTDVIVFHEPGTSSFYWLKESCANPLGDIDKLRSATFDMDMTLSTNPPQVGGVAEIVAGDPVSLTVALRNDGPAASLPGDIQIMYPGAPYIVRPCAPTCNPSTSEMTNMTGGVNNTRTFRNGNSPGLPAGTNWHWQTVSFDPGTHSGTINFTTPPGLAVGTVFQVHVYYTPENINYDVIHHFVSFRVISRRTPGITGANGDIHAGDCTELASNGYVQTSSTGASRGQYVVSATGLISGLRSDNAAGTGNRLKIGANGGYVQTQLCRPDIYALANAEDPLPGSSSFGSAPVVLNGTEEGVYYHRSASGTTLFVHGVVGNPVAPGVARKPLTIVADGDVVIDGNITLSTSTLPPHDVPSLGIIAAGNIYINAAATRVDAYMFANGNIYTCNGTQAQCSGTPPNPATQGALRVNGFLMAKDVIYGRLGVYNTNGTAASETIVLGPQIYLNPPKYFDSSIDNILLQGQGERAPLF